MGLIQFSINLYNIFRGSLAQSECFTGWLLSDVNQQLPPSWKMIKGKKYFLSLMHQSFSVGQNYVGHAKLEFKCGDGYSLCYRGRIIVQISLKYICWPHCWSVGWQPCKLLLVVNSHHADWWYSSTLSVFWTCNGALVSFRSPLFVNMGLQNFFLGCTYSCNPVCSTCS